MSKRIPRGEEVDGLTEWFQNPTPDLPKEEIAYQKVCQTMDVPERPKDGEQSRIFHALYINALQDKWVTYNGMNKREIATRLNEASKMVHPDNQKMLPKDIADRTGLEMNPLWMMECIVRSGTLKPGQQVTALKTLAEYTHSKTPSFSAHASAELSAEEWLKALANEQYETIELETDDQDAVRVERPKKKIVINQKAGRPTKGAVAQREARENLDLDHEAIEAEYEELVAHARETGNGSGTEETS